MLKRGTVEPEGAPVAVVPALCAAADGKGNRGDPAPLSVVSSAEKERLQEAPVRALWGRSIFVLG